MKSPSDDIERRLRDHYHSLSMSVTDDVVEGARARLGSRRQHRAPSMLAAASLGAVLLVAIAVGVGTSPTPTPAPTWTSAGPAETLSPSQFEVSSTRPAYGSGQLLRATRSFQLTDDWVVYQGQSLFIVAREREGSGEVYTIQHWGDLVTGLRPDTVVGKVPATIVEERTEPYDPVCPATVAVVEHVAALQPFERLVCFGAADLTFGPVQREEYAVMAGTPPWLGGEAGVDFFTALPFDIADGVDVPERRWLRITGHFDDPGCASRITCRERFVVTAAEPTDPPSSELQGTWTRMADAPIAGRSSYLAIPIDRGTFIWGGDGQDAADGAIYRASDDSWTALPPVVNSARQFQPAGVWTGEEVLIWGGNDETQGLAYNLAADRWVIIPAAPIAAGSAVGAWTGSEFLVVSSAAEAAAWNPSSRTWRRLPDAPIPRGYLDGVWTGQELIVLGLTEGGNDPIVGAALDPKTNSWRALAEVPYYGLMLGIDPLWTGTHMLFVSQSYDPATDRWKPLSIEGCRRDDVSSGVWTGRWVISQVGAYVPSTGRCLTLPEGPPRPGFEEFGPTHEFHTPAWDDGHLVVWSGGTGLDGPGSPADGIVFTPDEP